MDQFIIQTIKYQMQQTQDPRATVIKNVSEEQHLIEQILKQIPPLQLITFDILIDLFEKCPEIRDEPEFIEAIFHKNQIYQEFVSWILQPAKMIECRQKSNVPLPRPDCKRKYPFVSTLIAKDNSLFYIHLYLKAYFQPNSLSIWFEFLKDPNPQTFNTSLGYFTEIIIPFLKYQFADSTKICEQLAESVDDDVLVSSSVIARDDTPVSKEREFISHKKKQSCIERQVSILAIFSDSLLQNVFGFIDHEAIFKFVHNLILVSLQENDLKRSKKLFEAFLKKSLQLDMTVAQDQEIRPFSGFDKCPTMDVCSEYILQILNEIYINANTQKNYRVIFFIDSIIRVKVIEIFIQRIQHSPLMVRENNEEKLASSADFSAIVAEEEILESYIRSLTMLIKIYSKMAKDSRPEQEKERQSKYYVEEQQKTQEEVSGQNKVMRDFSSQIKQIFSKLPQLSYLVKKSQTRILPFSSGQNIKPITQCKYQFFELLYNCLILSKEYPGSFVLDTEKINIFSIIDRYLQQNRWNNLAHKVLEKIACLLIVDNKNFFRTKQMSKNNMADQFLNSIIQNFTNKKYIFLNSLRFTSQGNIHTLYTIAKAIINKLKQSHKLANFVHELDYYKKFVMNDLQEYQKKIKEVKYLPEKQDMPEENQNQENEENDHVKLYVDELSVSEIVKKIDIVSKWPLKENKRKHGSFIHRSLSIMSDQQPSTSLFNSSKGRKNIPLPSQQILNTSDIDQNQDSLKARQKQSFLNLTASPRDMVKSEIRDLTKSTQRQPSIFKEFVKKAQKRNLQSSLTESKCIFSENSPDMTAKERIEKELFGKEVEQVIVQKNLLTDDFWEKKEQKKKQMKNSQSKQGKGLFSSVDSPKEKSKSKTQLSPERKSSQHEQKQKKSASSQSQSKHNEPLRINLISSDKKLHKLVSIEQKTQQKQTKQKNEENKSAQKSAQKKDKTTRGEVNTFMEV